MGILTWNCQHTKMLTCSTPSTFSIGRIGVCGAQKIQSHHKNTLEKGCPIKRAPFSREGGC